MLDDGGESVGQQLKLDFIDGWIRTNLFTILEARVF